MKYLIGCWVFLIAWAQPIEVIIGTDSTPWQQPFALLYNFNTYEAIYRQSEIDIAGLVTHLGFYKSRGNTAIDPDVIIYMKQTTDTTLLSGPYSLNGYTQVYQGTFPNYNNACWMNVELSQPFYYDNNSNLAILILKTYQQWHSSPGYWRYSNTARYLTRYASSDNSQPIYLNQTYYRCNLRLVITPVGIEETNLNKMPVLTMLYPPKPNPIINGITHILFSNAELTKVTVKIYDAEGKQIRTLVDEVMPAGMKDIVWNCQDDNNEKVAKGMYFVMLTTPDQRVTQKITLLR
ncbi:MAG: T9SS type A sorting domain-containing protein [candidate division WOR-3 bacterium]